MKRRHSRILLGLLALILLVLGIALWPSQPSLGTLEPTGIAGVRREEELRKALPTPESQAPVVQVRKPRAASPAAPPPPPIALATQPQAPPQPPAPSSTAAVDPGVEYGIRSGGPVRVHGAQTSYAGTISEVRTNVGGKESVVPILQVHYSQERCVLVADVDAGFRRGHPCEVFRTFESASVDWRFQIPREAAEDAGAHRLEPGLASLWIGRLLHKTLQGSVIDESPQHVLKPPQLPATISGKGWDLGMHAFLPEAPSPIGATWNIAPAALLQVLAPADDLAWVRANPDEESVQEEEHMFHAMLARCVPGGSANQQQLGTLQGEITAVREGWMDVDEFRLDRARIQIDVTGRSEDATLAAELERKFAEVLGEPFTARAELTYAVRGGGLYAWDALGRRAPLTELHCEMGTQMKWSFSGPAHTESFEVSFKTEGNLAFLGGITERNAAIWETLKVRDRRFLKDESYVLVK